MKRRISLLLAVVMILGSFSFAFAADDAVKPGKFLEDKGVLLGDTKGDLNLDKPLERRDSVVLLSRLLGVEKEAKGFTEEGLPTWKDNNDKYYNGFLAWAQSNKYFQGHTEEKFGPRDNITVKEYAVVLLRALGYVDEAAEWDKVFDTAKKIGLLEGVDKKADEEVLRGEMAQMTFIALGTKMKGLDKTLAEELSIDMPTPEKLEIDTVIAKNLKEIEVKYNKEVDEESAIDLVNYETDAGDIQDITYVKGDNIARILLKEDSKMKDKKDYEITINGVKDDKNVLEDITKKFTANDNAIPEVVEVVGLGTKAVRITVSEPVVKVGSKNFKLDGKDIYGTVDVSAGRDIIFKTHTDMSVGEHTLTISGLEDYAGFKSVEADHKFDVIEDKEAPTVAEVSATLERVVLTFSEDVDKLQRNKVYWKDGSDKKYADDIKRLAGNKFEVTFKSDDALPAHEVTLYLEDVVDFSGNKLQNSEVKVKPTIDTRRPEVRSVEVKEDGKVIEVKFNKAVYTGTEDDEKASAMNYKNYKVIDKDDDKLVIDRVTNPKKDERTFEVKLGKELKADETYTFKISGIKDNNKYANYMVDYSKKISRNEYDKPKLETVTKTGPKKEKGYYKTELYLYFNRSMDIGTVSNPENYLIEVDSSNKLLTKFDHDIDVLKSDGKVVLLTIEDDKFVDVDATAVAALGVKGSNGKELSNYGKMIDVSDGKFDVKEDGAVAKAKDKIEIEFTVPVDKAPERAFGGVRIKSVDIDGKKVTLKLREDELSANAEEEITIYEDEIEAYTGAEFNDGKDKRVVLKDEIKPSIDKVSAKLSDDKTKVEIFVTFDEIVKPIGEYDTDFVVTRVGESKKLDILGKGHGTAADGTADNKVIKLELKVSDVKLDTDLMVEVKDKARFVEDAKGNLAKASEKRTSIKGSVEDVIDAGKTVKINTTGVHDLGGKTVKRVEVTTYEAGTITLKNGTVLENLVIDAPNAHVVNELTVKGNVEIIAVAADSFVNKGTIEGDVIVKTSGIKIEGVAKNKIKNGTNVAITIKIGEEELVIPAKEAEKVAAVTANPAAGAVDVNTEVALATTTEGATIYYTVDGEAPTVNSAKYTEKIVIDEAKTIKAIAVKEGMANSEVASFAYTIKVVEPEKSKDVSISEVKVAEVTANVDSEDATKYTVTVPFETIVNADALTLKLADGATKVVTAEGNVITIVVTAEDGETTKTYTVTVTVAAESEEETLTSITNPEAITGVANGTAKTAEALGLPATVTIVTSKGNKTANVTWGVESSTYNVDTKTAQTFDVTGTVELPAGVTNPNTVELTAKVSVTVDAEVPVPAPVGADQMAITATTIEGVTTTFENGKVTITISDSVSWAEVFEAQTPNADLGGEEQYAYVGISVKKPNTPEGITHVLINDGTKDVVAEIGAHDATTADGRFYYFAVAKMIPATEGVEVKHEVLTDTDAKTRIVKWYDSEDGKPILEQKFEVMRVKGE